MADLWRDFWIRETGTGQQVAQLHDRYDDDDDDALDFQYYNKNDTKKIKSGSVKKNYAINPVMNSSVFSNFWTDLFLVSN